MIELKTMFLTIITENLKNKAEAEILSGVIKNELGELWEIEKIEPYHKFKNSYKIELKITFIEKEQHELNNLAIIFTDQLLSPWLVYFDHFETSIELIYNKADNTQKRKIEFEAIKWGHLQIVTTVS
ncbi:hypothetical protein EZJ43_14880 [Pedobacter changchengzhani]|uniref:Uncharacterized protein n=1 Tax=Pedobacter changchengzhani TaxID=2529274 RepID=A0A4R5MI41_9SPHI|nr:hypothetical protein [Pedobacter changchengzhani]TDG35181.1 hypothetical protein EZJ43_14880 [Pedobacter changchengzhani]